VSNPAVFLHQVGEDQHVIKVHGDNAFSDQILEDFIHHHLEGGQTIGEAEVHDKGFE
jgi:spore coat polysaccharide biosynthesis protein SpsF (cytidylyltransferase family)